MICEKNVRMSLLFKDGGSCCCKGKKKGGHGLNVMFGDRSNNVQQECKPQHDLKDTPIRLYIKRHFKHKLSCSPTTQILPIFGLLILLII